MLSGKESVSTDKAIINNEILELRRSTRVNAGIAKPRFGHEKKEVNFTRSLSSTDFSSNHYIFVTKGFKEIGLPVEKAIMAELSQLKFQITRNFFVQACLLQKSLKVKGTT